MKDKLKILAASLALAAPSCLFAQETSYTTISSDYNPIPSSVQMLNIAPEARGSSLGDAGVATTPDINSQYWNPAKYIRMDSKCGAALSVTPWLRNIISDINLFSLMGYYKIDNRNCVSMGIRYFSLGTLQFYNDKGDEEGSYKPNEFAIDAAYSLALSRIVSGAIALRYIHSDLGFQYGDDGYSKGNAFAADIAFYLKKPLTIARNKADFMAGINLSNIGSKISYDDGQTNEYLPANLRLGVGFWYQIDRYNKIGGTVDFNKLMVPTPDYHSDSSDEDMYNRKQAYYSKSVISSLFKSFADAPGGAKEEFQEVDICAGVEYTYNNMFSARFGYHNNPENKGNLKYCTVGLGVKYQMIDVSASYVFSVGDKQMNQALANTVRISLAFDIAKFL